MGAWESGDGGDGGDGDINELTGCIASYWIT